MKNKNGSDTDPNPSPISTECLTFRGLGVSPGIAIGPAYSLQGAHWGELPHYTIESEEVPGEVERLRSGITEALNHLSKVRSSLDPQEGEEGDALGLLLDAHSRMLQNSRLVREAERHIIDDLINAEAAVRMAVSMVAEVLRQSNDSYLADRANDIWDVGRRILQGLGQQQSDSFDDLPQGAILFVEELGPADVAQMDPKRIGGFVTTLGGAEGHTAIIARALGIPAVLGVAHSGGTVATGDIVVLDGRNGIVTINPDETFLEESRHLQGEEERENKALQELKDYACETRDGTRIHLRANLELPIELESVIAAGAEGIGLLRTEFLFMNRRDLPSEDEQYNMLSQVVTKLKGQSVTVRTLDVGGEKAAPALENWLGHAPNPALGLRAVRLSLRVPNLLKTQLRAMLRAAVHAHPNYPMRILLPMVVAADEIVSVRRIMREAAEALRNEGHVLLNSPPPLGVMIEVPGAALAADALAQEADFFALGTNDLTMYTLAIDRGDERTAELYNPLHPAVLRLIHFAIKAAEKERIPISVCGEIAGDPLFAPLLIGLGLSELSMSSYSLPLVKKRIRMLSMNEAVSKALTIMDCYDADLIKQTLEDPAYL